MMNTQKSTNASKWMRTALLAVLATATAGCNNNEMPDTGNNPEKQNGKMTIHVAAGQEAPGTRVAYDDSKVDAGQSNVLTWQTDDKLTVVRMNAGTYMDHKDDYLYKGKDGDTAGSFEGTEITAEGDNWAVYYPNTVTVSTKDGTPTLRMTGQAQAADNSTAHLKNYMLLAATNLPNLNDGFSLEMKSSIMKFVLVDVPEKVGKLKRLKWTVETATGSTRNITLDFAKGAVDFGNGNSTLTAYLAFMPQEMEVKAGGKFSVMLTGDKSYQTEITMADAKTYEAGKRYTAEMGSAGWQQGVATMKLTVTVQNDNKGFNIPFPTNDKTPAKIIVDWGDGNTSEIASGTSLSTCNDFNHNYSRGGTYQITITSEQADETLRQIPYFNFYYNRRIDQNFNKIISVDTPLLNTGSNFNSCFYFCMNLKSIPQGLFDNNTQGVTSFESCFENCIALQSIPEGLFDQHTEVTSFEKCFYQCNNLVLNEKIFSIDGSPTRFAGKNMNFENCFYGVGSGLPSGTTGIAPDLWNYDQGGATWKTSSCFFGADSHLENGGDIPAEWK